MAEEYDVVVIGTGPGGYVCAIKAAQLGLKTAVVEKRATFGGTCLNIGCIPSKALLHASEMFEEAGHTLAELGVETGAPKLDLAKMMGHKDATVKSNVQGVEFLFKKNGVDTFHGTGRLEGGGKVVVAGENGGGAELQATNIVIATGSDVISLPGIEIDEDRVVSSTGALEIGEVPEHLIVVGGGVIGLEIGSVWRRLGAKVTVVEFLDRILAGMDGDVAKQFQRMLKKQGIDFRLSSKVTGVDATGNQLKVSVEPAKGGDAETLEASHVLVAIGRKPFTEGLGLEEAGVATDDKGRVVVDGHRRTGTDGVWAIGDVTDGPMLAHKAEDEGVAVAERIAGQAGHVNYGVIPNVVYTMPEVASVGASEDDLKADGIAYTVGKFPFSANGRARAMLHTDGFVKFLADKETDRVLGVHIVGASAGDMIHEAAVLMEFGGSSEDLARTCHAHPTLSEAVREAAMASAFGKPIHA